MSQIRLTPMRPKKPVLGLPFPGFTVPLKLRNESNETQVIQQAFCSLTFDPMSGQPHRTKTAADNEFMVCPETPIRLRYTSLSPEDTCDGEIMVLLDPRAIRAIENVRPRSGDLGFGLTPRILVAKSRTFNAAAEESPGRMLSYTATDRAQAATVSVIAGDEGGPHIRISRDEWLDMLRSWRFSELENFELPVYQLTEEMFVAEAVRALREAQDALRGGRNDAVLDQGKKAFEALATTVGESPDVKAAWVKLWERALPHTKDQQKQQPLDEIVGWLTDFQNLGRHLKAPFTPIDPADALLSLRLTLAIFEYLGVRLGETR